MRSVSNTLSATISKTIELRIQAAGFEGPASEIEHNPQSSEAERGRAEELRAKAKKLREQAHASKLQGLSLFAALRELKGDLDIRLIGFGENGQDLRRMLDEIQFSSWSAARGWPLATDDEGGIQRGLATLGKLLGAIIDMFPQPSQSEEAEDPSRDDALRAKTVDGFPGVPSKADSAASLVSSQYRAQLVAQVMRKLNVLRPQLFVPSDYARLKTEHPDYLTFQVTETDADLRTRVQNIQANRQHTRLALQIAIRAGGFSPANPGFRVSPLGWASRAVSQVVSRLALRQRHLWARPGFTCKNRLCPFEMRARSMAAVHRFGPILETLEDPRYIVLTVENCALEELRRGIDDLFSAFGRLRHSKLWIEVRGALAVLEVTFNEEKRTWHPHINIVVDGPYIEKAALDAAWLRSTRGKGRITWIERADHRTVFELIKYVTKLADFVHIPEAVGAFLDATRKTRFLRTYGCLYGLKIEDEESENGKDPLTACPDCGSKEVVRLRKCFVRDDVFFDGKAILRFCEPVDPFAVVVCDG